jgi:hypothetical protein
MRSTIDIGARVALYDMFWLHSGYELRRRGRNRHAISIGLSASLQSSRFVSSTIRKRTDKTMDENDVFIDLALEIAEDEPQPEVQPPEGE